MPSSSGVPVWKPSILGLKNIVNSLHWWVVVLQIVLQIPWSSQQLRIIASWCHSGEKALLLFASQSFGRGSRTPTLWQILLCHIDFVWSVKNLQMNPFLQLTIIFFSKKKRVPENMKKNSSITNCGSVKVYRFLFLSNRPVPVSERNEASTSAGSDRPSRDGDRLSAKKRHVKHSWNIQINYI